jgi:hypothetical protein
MQSQGYWQEVTMAATSPQEAPTQKDGNIVSGSMLVPIKDRITATLQMCCMPGCICSFFIDHSNWTNGPDWPTVSNVLHDTARE